MGKMDLLEPVFHPRQHDFVKGEGAWLFDRAGNRYLDLNEMCVFLGQGNRRFIDKVTEALNGVTNGRSSAVRYKEQLTDYLMESTNHIFKAVHYTASGSETTEWAVRLAQKITGRTEVVSFWNSIHGRLARQAAQDAEGLQTMRTLARNMAFLVKSIALGREKYGLPEREEPLRTHFIR